MKRLAFTSLIIAAIVAFALPAFGASSDAELTQGEDVPLSDLVEVESVQAIDTSAASSPELFTDSLKERNECSGGGATCSCSGTCEADSSGCQCT